MEEKTRNYDEEIVKEDSVSSYNQDKYQGPFEKAFYGNKVRVPDIAHNDENEPSRASRDKLISLSQERGLSRGQYVPKYYTSDYRMHRNKQDALNIKQDRDREIMERYKKFKYASISNPFEGKKTESSHIKNRPYKARGYYSNDKLFSKDDGSISTEQLGVGGELMHNDEENENNNPVFGNDMKKKFSYQ